MITPIHSSIFGRRRSLWLCMLSGAILAISFPPLRLGFVVYSGLIPFFVLIESDHRWKASLKYGFLTGLAFHLGTVYWIAWDTEPGHVVIIPATIVVALILSLFFAGFAWCLCFLRRRIGIWGFLAAPLVWVSIEYVRSLGALAFPWNSLAYSQSYYLPLIQICSFTSIYGIAFWIVLVNALFFLWIKLFLRKRTSLYILGGVLAVFVGLIMYGRSRIPAQVQKADVRIALAQGNIDPLIKWDKRYEKDNLDIYVNMTETVPAGEVDLIVWPETAIPVYIAYEDNYKSEIHRLADKLATPILTGAPHVTYDAEDNVRYHNSVFLFSPMQDTLPEYSKMHLVPFSEYLPFQKVFPFLKKLNFGQSEFSPGTEYSLFRIPKGRFAVLICFESIFPDLVRRFVNQDVDFLVNITNDAWFGKTSAPFQHARIAVFRAIENGIGLARCANTGVSMFVDPYGRVSEETSIYSRKIAMGGIASGRRRTFYTAHGDVFARICCVLTAGLILAGLTVKGRSSQFHDS